MLVVLLISINDNRYTSESIALGARRFKSIKNR